MNPYDVLGVHKNASDATIKTAFRKLVQEHHPDHDPTGDPARFREIVDAYNILKDKKKRKQFDATGRIPKHRNATQMYNEAVAILSVTLYDSLDEFAHRILGVSILDAIKKAFEQMIQRREHGVEELTFKLQGMQITYNSINVKGGENLLRKVVKDKIEDTKELIEEIQRLINVYKLILEILEDYYWSEALDFDRGKDKDVVVSNKKKGAQQW